jgi:hypothetical protein
MIQESIFDVLMVLELCMVRSDGDGGVDVDLGLVDDNRAAGLVGGNFSFIHALTMTQYMEADPDASLCRFALSRWSQRSRRKSGHGRVNVGD